MRAILERIAGGVEKAEPTARCIEELGLSLRRRRFLWLWLSTSWALVNTKDFDNNKGGTVEIVPPFIYLREDPPPPGTHFGKKTF